MDGRRKPWFKCEKTEAAIEQPIASPVSPLYEPEKSLLTYQYFSFGISISPRILAYQPGFWHIKYVWSTFGVSVRILAYQFMFLYHLPLQYRIEWCFHPVHAPPPVFLQKGLGFWPSTTSALLSATCVISPPSGHRDQPSHLRRRVFIKAHPIHDSCRDPVFVFSHALLAS